MPACIGMIRLARGEQFTPADEEELHGDALAGGNPLRLLALRALPRARYESPALDVLLPMLSLWLSEGCWLIISVSSPRYVKWRGHAPAGLPSPHGPLCPAGDWGGVPHALVLIALTSQGFLALDPYYPGARQPFALSEDVILDIATTEVIIAEL